MRVSRTLLVCLSLSGILVGSAVIFNKWSNNPASTTKSSTVQSEVLSSQISLKSFQTTYYSTLIPESFIVKSRNENPQGSIIGSYLLRDSNMSIGDQVGITVGKLSNSPLDSISAVKVRQSKPNEYTKAEFSNMPSNAIGYERIDGYEKAVFWPKNGNYIAVVISGTVQRQPQMDQTLQAILANWQ